MGSIAGHRIDYNGVGVMRGQRHIPNQTSPKYPPPGIVTVCQFLVQYISSGIFVVLGFGIITCSLGLCDLYVLSDLIGSHYLL